jgi:hypothetical protein
VTYRVTGITSDLVITRMSSDIPLPSKGICNFLSNEHSFCASKIYAHKKMVPIMTHKLLSLIIFLQSCVIIFCQICTVMCRKCVILCTIKVNEFHFGN